MPKPAYDLATLRRAIRAECTRQGIDDDGRRALMLSKADVRSSTDLDLRGAQRVLDHLRRTGGKPVSEWAFVFRAPADRQPHLKKIYKQAQARNWTKGYVESIAEQMAKVETKLEFCDVERLHKIVQAIEVFKRRHGLS